MKDPNFFIPENVDEFEELAISITEGDVAMPKDASQELIEKVEEFTSVKKQLSEIDLPSNSIRDAQIQVAVSIATDKVVVPPFEENFIFFKNKRSNCSSHSVSCYWWGVNCYMGLFQNQ